MAQGHPVFMVLVFFSEEGDNTPLNKILSDNSLEKIKQCNGVENDDS